MRKQLLAIFLNAAADQSLGNSRTPRRRARELAARASYGDSRWVAGGAQPQRTGRAKVSTLADPPRLVLDFANTSLATSQRRSWSNRRRHQSRSAWETRRARRALSSTSSKPATTRFPPTANRLLVTFKSKSDPAAASTPVPAASVADPATASSSPFASKVMPVRMKAPSAPAKADPSEASLHQAC